MSNAIMRGGRYDGTVYYFKEDKVGVEITSVKLGDPILTEGQGKASYVSTHYVRTDEIENGMRVYALAEEGSNE